LRELLNNVERYDITIQSGDSLEAINLDGLVTDIILVTLKLGGKVDRSAKTIVGILVEDGNDLTMLGIDHTTHSCYGNVYHLMVANGLGINTIIDLVDNIDI